MAAAVPNGHPNAAADGTPPPPPPSSSSSSLVFLGTGCSRAVPNARCLIQPPDPPCAVCSQSLSVPPELNPNYRCCTSVLIDYCQDEGAHKYIIIDVGKTFREQVLRCFVCHKIPCVDSILLTHEHADAILGLDDVRVVQPFSPTNDIDPTPIYLSQYAMDRVPGVYERWQDCHMQVNGFPGNRYKGYMSRAVAEENWRNHLRQQNRTRTRTNFIVTTTTFFFVVACVFYFFTSRA